MNKVLKVCIQITMLLLLIVAVYYFRDRIIEAFNNIANTNPVWITIIIIISLGSHLARAYRWNLLMEPLAHKPSLWHTFIAVMTGYFTNIFNMRGGEALRCVVLTRSDKVPFSVSFATVMAERVFDLLCLVFLIFVALLMEYSRLVLFIEKEFLGKSTSSSQTYFILGTIALGCILVMILLYFLRERLLKINFIKKIYDYIISLFVQAINSFLLLNKKKEFVLSTILIWLGYYLTTYLAFYAFPFSSQLGVSAGFMILVIGAIAVSIPIPGNLGYVYALSKAFVYFYMLTEIQGESLALFLFASQLITLLILGGICAIISLFIAPKTKESQVLES